MFLEGPEGMEGLIELYVKLMARPKVRPGVRKNWKRALESLIGKRKGCY